jgi:hypothetical protein
MGGFVRRHLTTIVVAMVTAAVTAGGPALAAAMIGTADIRNGAVTTPKLADAAVSAAKVAAGAVRTGKVADAAITAPKLSNSSVGTTKVADGAVTAPKLGSASVGTTKLASAAVTSGKIADGQVRAADLGIITTKQASFELAGGTSGGAQSLCDSGTRVVSGGHRVPMAAEGVYAVESGMQGNGWLVYLKNTTGTTFTVNVEAYCLEQ